MAKKRKTFIHPFRAWRRNRGISLEDVAKRAGISVPTLCRIERESRKVDVAVALRLIEISGGAVTIKDFA